MTDAILALLKTHTVLAAFVLLPIAAFFMFKQPTLTLKILLALVGCAVLAVLGMLLGWGDHGNGWRY